MRRIVVGLIIALLLGAYATTNASADATGTFRLGGPERDYAFDVARDGAGNLFVAGSFKGTVDFDPGPGVEERTSGESGEPTGPTRGRMDAFVAKYDVEGRLSSVLVLGGSGVNLTRSLAVDEQGGVVLGGQFSGTVDFDPSDPPDTSDTLEAGAGRNAYVARYDANGTFLWVVGFGDDDVAPPGSRELSVEWSEGVRDVAVDAAGNVYAVGMFRGVVDMDPSEETEARHSREGSRDAFLVTYDPDGLYRWDVVLGGSETDQAHAVALGPGGRIVVGGVYSDMVDFDPGPGEAVAAASGKWDAYVAFFASDGVFEKVFTWGGPGYDQVGSSGVAFTADGAVYAAGEFTGKIDFDPGRKRVMCESEGGTDGYVVRYDDDGKLDWVVTFGGKGADVATTLLRNRSGHVVVTGRFQGDVDFLPGGRKRIVKASGSGGASDAFVATYDEKGKLRWARAIGAEVSGPGNFTRGAGLARGIGDEVLAVGTYFGSPDLDPGRKTFLLGNQGGSDIYIVRLDAKGKVVP